MELNERLFEMKLKGYCCSRTIMALGLEDLGKENEDLIAAMGGFCNGMENGKLCGTLAAAVALLFLVDARAADLELRAALMDWFYDQFGGYDCDEIINGDPTKKVTFCPGMVAETYRKLQDLLDGKLVADGAGGAGGQQAGR
ncbi:MAG: C-GCAxxG-C-C family protein [Clostridiales Family XIII bacterium]|nr:C-GCAxxG-C-C family protein [Clostridiales Family XIII bacterium]